MGLQSRTTEVLRRAIAKLPGALGDTLKAMLTPANLAIMMGLVVGVTALSGGTADVVAGALGSAVIGQGLSDLIGALAKTLRAKTDQDLDQAAESLAKAAVSLGSAGLMKGIQTLRGKLDFKEVVSQGGAELMKGIQSLRSKLGVKAAPPPPPAPPSPPAVAVPPAAPVPIASPGQNALSSTTSKTGPLPFPLPKDPNDLITQHGYIDISHPMAAAQGGRLTFENPGTGDVLDFDKATPGASGFKGRDHYHRRNPNSVSKQDKYLDKDGNPVRIHSNPSHLVP